MKIIPTIIFILSVPFFCFPQGEFNNWYFGRHCGITFNSGTPVFLPGNPMNVGGLLAEASVSDSSGNLLFFSNGRKVWNRNLWEMPNGYGLLGGRYSCNPVMVVPFVTDPYKYYIFTVGGEDPDPNNPIVGLHYSVLNMLLNGGLGDIVAAIKNIPLPMGDSAIQQLTAIRHHNNKDAWLVTLRHGQVEEYLAYLIDSSGVSNNPVVSQSTLHNPIRGPGISSQTSDHIRISPDGKFLVCHDSLNEVCHFNSFTGIVTPMFTFRGGDTVISGGFEFSIKSRYLYTSMSPPDSSEYGSLHQYDMSNQDSLSFVNSGVHVGDSSGFQIQMGPDGKIYLDHWAGKHYLNVINNPSNPGLSCNYVQNAVYLEGAWYVWNYQSLCQFLQRYKAYVHNTGHCVSDSIHFTSDIWPPADSIHWDFGDPASGVSNFSNLANPVHLFSGPGTYTVELWVRHIDKRTDTTWVTIEFPNPQLGPDRTICTGDSITFDAGYCTGCTYLWTNLTTMQTLGTTLMITTGTPGLIMVAVTNSDTCTATDTVQLSLTPRPVITNTPLSKTICSGESTNIVLTSSVANTMFDWTATVISGTVTGASADSGLIIDQVLMNPGPNPGIVKYHITPHVGSCIGDTANYQVTVNPSLPVDVSIAASANPVCQGTSVTFTATPVNSGTSPIYQWKVNGINTGTSSPIYSYSPVNNDVVTCVLTSNVICPSGNPATSNPVTMTVNPELPVSVSITASQNPVCAGTSVTFTATPVNGGTSPVYQWKVNGNNAGTNSPNYSYSPGNNDVVTSVLTSNVICPSGNPATSNPITMTVNPILPVIVSITASINPVCGGIPVSFTAIPVHGGVNPSYQWQVNGINTGANNSIFTYYPSTGDLVSCILTSSESCTSGNPATSNSITMSVGEQPAVSFSICFDTITTLNAKPYKLKGGIPLGGTYTGPGVDQINGYFIPAMAGLGTKSITYSYTNVYQCSNYFIRTITVINPAPFTCGNSITDIRDNRIYLTVQIGSQCWLAENLNYGLQTGSSLAQRDNCLVEKYCYNDFPANCQQHGALYQWDELMRYEEAEEIQGLCPPGWHVPAEVEWNILFTNWTNNAFAGAPLKYSGYSGFNALPIGVELFNQRWEFDAFATFYWSSTSHGTYKAWAHGMNEYNYSVSYYPSYRANAFSVRCLRD